MLYSDDMSLTFDFSVEAQMNVSHSNVDKLKGNLGL